MNTYNNFPVIETERLKLRPVLQSDMMEIFSTFSDTEAMQFYGMEPLKSEEEAYSLIEAFEKSYKSGSAIRWGIVLKEENTLIGTCGFHNWSKSDQRTEVGYELNRKYWHQGFMNETLRAIIHYGFNGLDFNRIAATIRPENTSSRELIEKLGFHQEALLKEYQKADGEFYDMYVYALLKRNADLY
ncbi:GNAT family N-acetyltransferase [Fictibacillus phosphorivorans]|uniref:GNAT family N-acetyltransferase n=1 Tax=Fictibacillus phosphorivorans TaxID=1221500 RepID=UPI00203D5A82|nr:GNAT family N-acetyltransferase [Fictibacillus phosphorivorans]MCM3719252.1 GNAT family N-acetyltransferase [Fictibacillus phosphorivorans]MCM3776874.1 GNAT family N-acetyltransferase [Fictibacillus phosphorivorans]